MSFNYDADRGDSAVIVPEHIIRRDDEVLTLATLSAEAAENPSEFLRGLRASRSSTPAHSHVAWSDGALALDRWQEQVSRAVGRIEAGALDKVVLARSIIGTSDAAIDLGWLVSQLATAHPSCWTFLVDGWVGATPEMLVRRNGSEVASRVLAGTIKRSTDEFIDGDLATQLRESDKDLAEHAYAVKSVADVLAAHCTDLDVPHEPSLLQLANVQHLATDVTGELADDVPAVALAGSLHPTAAVCGTPTERAASVIGELEQLDRGRYAAPVGWSDSHGDGEFGIALRCGHVLNAERTRIELFAGCGIVAGSTAELERAESEAKLQAMRKAVTP
jgi:menaquinone-specific isochorismate synthase